MFEWSMFEWHARNRPLSSIPTWIRTRIQTFGGSDVVRYTIGMAIGHLIETRRFIARRFAPENANRGLMPPVA